MIYLTRPQLLAANIESAPCRVFVTFQKHGLHRYPGAPEDVAYLSNAHRHLFKFRVDIDVKHDNREIEFHQFQNWLMSQYDDKVLALDFKSCEMIARDMLTAIINQWGDRQITIEVSEDGECGAVLSYKPVED